MSLRHRIIQLIAPEYADAPERIYFLRNHLQAIRSEFTDPLRQFMLHSEDERVVAMARDSRDSLIRDLSQQALDMDNDLYDGGTHTYRNRYGGINPW